MSVELTAAQADRIRRHGAEEFPHECCGFLLGTASGGRKRVERIVRAGNAREDGARRNRFLITPQEVREGERLARRAGLDVLGFYHSHPGALARPSRYDLEHAWPWYSYLIVAVAPSGAGEMTSWVLEDDRSSFLPEPIEIGGDRCQ